MGTKQKRERRAWGCGEMRRHDTRSAIRHDSTHLRLRAHLVTIAAAKVYDKRLRGTARIRLARVGRHHPRPGKDHAVLKAQNGPIVVSAHIISTSRLVGWGRGGANRTHHVNQAPAAWFHASANGVSVIVVGTAWAPAARTTGTAQPHRMIRFISPLQRGGRVKEKPIALRCLKARVLKGGRATWLEGLARDEGQKGIAMGGWSKFQKK